MPDDLTIEEAELTDDETEEEEEDTGSKIFSPEGLIMLLLAIFFDVGEFLIEIISKPLLAIPYAGVVFEILFQIGQVGWDVLAFIFIGIWLIIRTGSVKGAGQKVSSQTAQIAKKAKWLKRLKWLRPILAILEFIPIIDNIPAWTLMVYLELKYGG